MGGYQETHGKQGYDCKADLSGCLEFLDISHPTLSGTKRETPLKIEFSLMNVNVSYRR